MLDACPGLRGVHSHIPHLPYIFDTTQNTLLVLHVNLASSSSMMSIALIEWTKIYCTFPSVNKSGLRIAPITRLPLLLRYTNVQ